MKILLKKGTKKKRIAIFIGSGGFGITGLTSNSITCYRYRQDDGDTGGAELPLHDGTRGTWSSGGFVEKDSVNMPGTYELGLDNAGLAPGSDVAFYLLNGDNISPVRIEIQLIDLITSIARKSHKKKMSKSKMSKKKTSKMSKKKTSKMSKKKTSKKSKKKTSKKPMQMKRMMMPSPSPSPSPSPMPSPSPAPFQRNTNMTLTSNFPPDGPVAYSRDTHDSSDTVIFTATITNTDDSTPVDGTVTFTNTDGDKNICVDVTVSGGQASCTTNDLGTGGVLTPGPNIIAALFNPSAKFYPNSTTCLVYVDWKS